MSNSPSRDRLHICQSKARSFFVHSLPQQDHQLVPHTGEGVCTALQLGSIELRWRHRLRSIAFLCEPLGLIWVVCFYRKHRERMAKGVGVGSNTPDNQLSIYPTSYAGSFAIYIYMYIYFVLCPTKCILHRRSPRRHECGRTNPELCRGTVETSCRELSDILYIPSIIFACVIQLIQSIYDSAFLNRRRHHTRTSFYY